MEQNKINLWSNPAPTGYAAFAMVTGLLALNFWGLIPKNNFPILFAVTMAGAVAQIATGLIELRNGEESGGNLMLTMGCLFMLAPGITFLMAALNVAVPVPIMGYMNIMLGVFQAIYMIPMSRKPWFVFSMAPMGTLGLTQIGLIELGFSGLRPFCAINMAFLCFWALYMIANKVALTANINIPLGKPLSIFAAPEHHEKAQLHTVQKEALSS